MTIVRDFSAAGPCITLGLFVKRTKKFIVYREWLGGDRYSDKLSRVGGHRVALDLVHTSPCPSCRDHAETQYPNGYMD